MVTDSSNQPGWGASAGGSGGSSTPPPSTPSGGGKYTDASGKPISKQKAIELGIISGSDVKTTPSGWGGGSAPAKGAPVGVEALKQGELRSAQERNRILQPGELGYHAVASNPAGLGYTTLSQTKDSFTYRPNTPEDYGIQTRTPQLNNVPPPSLMGSIRTPAGLRYYPSQPGSIAEQNAPIRWYDRLHPVVKGAAIVASLDFSIYHSYLSSKLGSGFDPSEGLQLESATMGNETITFKTTKPKVDELYKKQLYEHYEMGNRPKGAFNLITTGAFKGISSDVAITGVSAFAFGGAVGAIGRIKGLGFIPGVAGKLAVGVTVADVGLKVATKDYSSAIITGGAFVAFAPMAFAGYNAGKGIVPSIGFKRAMFGTSKAERMTTLRAELIATESAVGIMPKPAPLIPEQTPLFRKMFGASKETRASELRTSFMAETQLMPNKPTWQAPEPKPLTITQKMFGVSRESRIEALKLKYDVPFIPGLGGYVRSPVIIPTAFTSIMAGGGSTKQSPGIMQPLTEQKTFLPKREILEPIGFKKEESQLVKEYRLKKEQELIFGESVTGMKTTKSSIVSQYRSRIAGMGEELPEGYKFTLKGETNFIPSRKTDLSKGNDWVDNLNKEFAATLKAQPIETQKSYMRPLKYKEPGEVPIQLRMLSVQKPPPETLISPTRINIFKQPEYTRQKNIIPKIKDKNIILSSVGIIPFSSDKIEYSRKYGVKYVHGSKQNRFTGVKQGIRTTIDIVASPLSSQLIKTSVLQRSAVEQVQRTATRQFIQPMQETTTKPKRELIRKTKLFEFPTTTTISLFKKKRKQAKMGRFFIEISPVKSVGTNIFKGMSAYKPIKIKGMKL